MDFAVAPDFLVDGVSLYDQLRAGDQVTPLGCWSPDSEREYIQQLLSASGRVPLYVCAECGDLGCGAIAALVERMPDGFVWRDFACEYASRWVPPRVKDRQVVHPSAAGSENPRHADLKARMPMLR